MKDGGPPDQHLSASLSVIRRHVSVSTQLSARVSPCGQAVRASSIMADSDSDATQPCSDSDSSVDLSAIKKANNRGHESASSRKQQQQQQQQHTRRLRVNEFENSAPSSSAARRVVVAKNQPTQRDIDLGLRVRRKPKQQRNVQKAAAAASQGRSPLDSSSDESELLNRVLHLPRSQAAATGNKKAKNNNKNGKASPHKHRRRAATVATSRQKQEEDADVPQESSSIPPEKRKRLSWETDSDEDDAEERAAVAALLAKHKREGPAAADSVSETTHKLLASGNNIVPATRPSFAPDADILAALDDSDSSGEQDDGDSSDSSEVFDSKSRFGHRAEPESSPSTASSDDESGSGTESRLSTSSKGDERSLKRSGQSTSRRTKSARARQSRRDSQRTRTDVLLHGEDEGHRKRGRHGRRSPSVQKDKSSGTGTHITASGTENDGHPSERFKRKRSSSRRHRARTAVDLVGSVPKSHGLPLFRPYFLKSDDDSTASCSRDPTEKELLQSFRPLVISKDAATTGMGGGSNIASGASVCIPGPTAYYLRPYQKSGVAWLYTHVQKNRGAILGDDMGLGKTVQIAALVSAVLRKTGQRDTDLRAKEIKVAAARSVRNEYFQARAAAAARNRLAVKKEKSESTGKGNRRDKALVNPFESSDEDFEDKLLAQIRLDQPIKQEDNPAAAGTNDSSVSAKSTPAKSSHLQLRRKLRRPMQTATGLFGEGPLPGGTRSQPWQTLAHPPILVVAPASVLHQWKQEFNTWGYFDLGTLNDGGSEEKETVCAVPTFMNFGADTAFCFVFNTWGGNLFCRFVSVARGRQVGNSRNFDHQL